MAENDEAAQQEAAGERTTGRKSTRTGRVSAERGGGGGRRDVSPLIAEFRRLSPAERAAFRAELAAGTAGRPGGGQTPKFSATLDRVEEGAAGELIGAIDEALEIVKERPGGDGEGAALEAVRAVDPDVAAAAVTNSGYRNKPISHSLRVARQYLADRFPEAVRDDDDDDTDDDRDRERR